MSSSVGGSPAIPPKFTSAEKRAVHNALERKRRDHIKDMFSQLKDSVPNLAGEKVSVKASRAQILKKACDYIQMMRRKNQASSKDLDLLNQQVSRTKKQIAKLESIRNTNRYVAGLSPTQTDSSPQSFLDPQHVLPSQTSSIQSSSGESSPMYASHQQIISMVTSMPSHIPGAVGPYPPGMIPVRMENFGMMARLPSMNSLQRFYVGDLSGQNNIAYENVGVPVVREDVFMEPPNPQSSNTDRG